MSSQSIDERKPINKNTNDHPDMDNQDDDHAVRETDDVAKKALKKRLDEAPIERMRKRLKNPDAPKKNN